MQIWPILHSGNILEFEWAKISCPLALHLHYFHDQTLVSDSQTITERSTKMPCGQRKTICRQGSESQLVIRLIGQYDPQTCVIRCTNFRLPTRSRDDYPTVPFRLQKTSIKASGIVWLCCLKQKSMRNPQKLFLFVLLWSNKIPKSQYVQCALLFLTNCLRVLVQVHRL